jgi:hypothetical protein
VPTLPAKSFKLKPINWPVAATTLEPDAPKARRPLGEHGAARPAKRSFHACTNFSRAFQRGTTLGCLFR